MTMQIFFDNGSDQIVIRILILSIEFKLILWISSLTTETDVTCLTIVTKTNHSLFSSYVIDKDSPLFIVTSIISPTPKRSCPCPKLSLFSKPPSPSILQREEQPSPSITLPSSHVSDSSIIEFHQTDNWVSLLIVLFVILPICHLLGGSVLILVTLLHHATESNAASVFCLYLVAVPFGGQLNNAELLNINHDALVVWGYV